MTRLLASLCLLAGIAISSTAFAQTVTTPSTSTSTVTYNGVTKHLTMPSVTAGDVIYNNLVIRLNDFTVISVGTSTPVTPTNPTTPTTPVATACTSANMTVAKFDAVAIGMTMAQVNQTIGCTYDPAQISKTATFARYSWLNLPTLIQVYFDVDGKIVTAAGASGTYKGKVGF